MWRTPAYMKELRLDTFGWQEFCWRTPEILLTNAIPSRLVPEQFPLELLTLLAKLKYVLTFFPFLINCYYSLQVYGVCPWTANDVEGAESVMTVITEIGEPLDVIKILQIPWDERLKVINVARRPIFNLIQQFWFLNRRLLLLLNFLPIFDSFKYLIRLFQWRRQAFLLGGKKFWGLGQSPRKFFFDHALYFGYKRDQRPLHRLRSR